MRRKPCSFYVAPPITMRVPEQLSQEVRLSLKQTSIAGVESTWTAGIYFNNQHRRFLDDEYIPGLQATYQKILGYGINSAESVVGPSYYPATTAFPGTSFANDLIYYGHTYPIQRQIAPFGELGVEITPALKAAVGVRYVSAKSSEVIDSGGFGGTVCRPNTGSALSTAPRLPSS